jgi:hypothetical protein
MEFKNTTPKEINRELPKHFAKLIEMGHITAVLELQFWGLTRQEIGRTVNQIWVEAKAGFENRYIEPAAEHYSAEAVRGKQNYHRWLFPCVGQRDYDRLKRALGVDLAYKYPVLAKGMVLGKV